MECPNCNKSMVVTDKIIAEFYICETCNYETIKYPSTCCFWPKNELVKFYKNEIDRYEEGDNYFVYNQCKSCGRKNGQALKKSDYKKNELKNFDFELQKNLDALKKEIQEHSRGIEIRKRENKRDTFWDDYAEYLKSEEWKIKRELVLKRDNYLCQSCLSKPAMQVHHKVGIFRKNEPLFTLVSVCNKCHDIITDIERGHHKDANKITYEK